MTHHCFMCDWAPLRLAMAYVFVFILGCCMVNYKIPIVYIFHFRNDLFGCNFLFTQEKFPIFLLLKISIFLFLFFSFHRGVRDKEINKNEIKKMTTIIQPSEAVPFSYWLLHHKNFSLSHPSISSSMFPLHIK